MKINLLRITLSLGSLLAIAILFLSPDVRSYSTGAPPSATGSPGDIGTCIQCHGAQTTNKPGWITSNVPTSGFEYNTTYTFNLSATHNGAAKIGFQACIEDPTQQKVGTIIVTDASRTQLVNNIYITHTSAGTTPSNNSNSWSFDWTSPAGPNPYMTAYVCFNAANGNGLATGDRLYTSTLDLFHNSTAGLAEFADAQVKLFPNPVHDLLTITPCSGEKIKIAIYSTDARLLRSLVVKEEMQLDISGLAPGKYLLQSSSDQRIQTYYFLKL